MGRSAMSVRDRMTKIGLESKNKRKIAWTKQEKDRLNAAVEKYGHDWQSISKSILDYFSYDCFLFILLGILGHTFDSFCLTML